jgi:hypothetical protein
MVLFLSACSNANLATTVAENRLKDFQTNRTRAKEIRRFASVAPQIELRQ